MTLQKMNQITQRYACILAILTCCVMGITSQGQDDTTAVDTQVNTTTADVTAVQPLADGETKELQAVVMDVTGRAQWRPDVDAAWKNAAVDDVLDSGALIRTGRQSSLTMRVGHNATVSVDSNTRISLAHLVQEGDQLKTAVQLKRGRTDIKVDRVGLTNDFSVVTPSSTLAVRGTGFGINYGGFRGTEVFASPFNDMRSIEMRYFGKKFSYFMSGGATSTNKHKNPVLSQMFNTFGPPMIMDMFNNDDEYPASLLADNFLWNPVHMEHGAALRFAALQRILALPDLQLPIEIPKCGDCIPHDNGGGEPGGGGGQGGGGGKYGVSYSALRAAGKASLDRLINR